MNPDQTDPNLREQSYLGLLQYAFNSFASRLKSGGYSSKPLVIFFSILYIFFKTKKGQLSVTDQSNEKQSIESINSCFI